MTISTHETPARTLKELVGEAAKSFQGRHHARYLRGEVPYHVISRVFQGRHLLRPSKQLNQLIIGVVGRALELYEDVHLYAICVMSNHLHMQMQGPPVQFSRFNAYVKREISYRWGRSKEVNWPGTMWEEYVCSALPTNESQIDCLEYILSQGVKEKLVAKPQNWPGVHSASCLLSDSAMHGEWFNGTNYSRKVDAERRRKRPKPVRRADYFEPYTVKLSPIPAWNGLDESQRRNQVREMVQRIEKAGRATRNGTSPIGRKAIMRVPRSRRSELPRQPWLQRGRTMICWADMREEQTREYVDAYWRFQEAFRAASISHRLNDAVVEYPAGAFVPMRYRPLDSVDDSLN